MKVNTSSNKRKKHIMP